MKTLILIFLLLPTVALAAYPDVQNTKLSHCYDGDTCTFIIVGCDCVLGHKIVVRFRGIDTPEIKGRCPREKKAARMARDRLRELMRAAPARNCF